MDEILNLIESVSEGFPSYSYMYRCYRSITNLQVQQYFIGPPIFSKYRCTDKNFRRIGKISDAPIKEFLDLRI